MPVVMTGAAGGASARVGQSAAARRVRGRGSQSWPRGQCENNRDHQPYTHACAYFNKSKSLMCRHPEEYCYRKSNDAAKNVKPRE